MIWMNILNFLWRKKRNEKCVYKNGINRAKMSMFYDKFMMSKWVINAVHVSVKSFLRCVYDSIKKFGCCRKTKPIKLHSFCCMRSHHDINVIFFSFFRLIKRIPFKSTQFSKIYWILWIYIEIGSKYPENQNYTL